MEANLVARLNALVDALSADLVERRQHIRLALLAALAGEHTLLIGPPGTAKSALSRRLHTAFRDARYFERLLTRFSVPEELFGPLSIKALEDDRYERQTAGFLPEASIAFIDEVFKANSAILNALLTLLNERQFDNGAGRQACPLISVIGATNAVPDDEVGEAFFDRFLLRLPVAPVSDGGFDALLKVSHGDTPPTGHFALSSDDLAELTRSAERTELPADFVTLLGELRRYCTTENIIASDRRWVKAVWLLRVAAASSGARHVRMWDLLLLPPCLGADAVTQGALTDWLTARLGVREAFSPARLTRVVEAFEAQLDLERKANDLDYDEQGRLKFSATTLAGDIADSIGDAKGGAAAPRMTYTRRRRYGRRHIDARVRQIDDALARLAGYAEEMAACRQDLADYRARNLWLAETLLDAVSVDLAGTAANIADLKQRLTEARAGFLDLPRLDPEDAGNDREPEPVIVEDLAAA